MGNDSSSRKRFSKKRESKPNSTNANANASANAHSNANGSGTNDSTSNSAKREMSEASKGSGSGKGSGKNLGGSKGNNKPSDLGTSSEVNGNGASASANASKSKELQDEGGAEGNDLVSQIADNNAKTRVTLDDFVLMKTVGKGSFGKVIQVKKKDSDKIYAMKVLKKEHVIRRKQFEHTMAERRILEGIDHPFIVSLRFAFQTTQKLYMVFDYFNGGELFHYLSKGGRFTEERSRLYAAEITLAIEHVHGMNIIYRDLKPENLLLDADGHIRITDFGLSKENVTEDDVKSFCGTPEYLAPEVLKRQKYGKAVDWWSLGTLLYEMISGLPPFYDRNRERMYKKILGAELRFPSHMAPEARSICRGMLTREPQERLGYQGADEIKSHPFFEPLDFDDVFHKRTDPPFKPEVLGEDDTGNVDKTFTAIPAAVTPTPADGHLAAAVDKEFNNFTFTAQNVLDGAQYSVSFDTEDEFEEQMNRQGQQGIESIEE